MTIKLQRVHYMPKDLEPSVLYVSEEFETAAHLCPCGCGSKVRTPLGATEWSFVETPTGPSLSPSVGNWQQPCRSHYWIDRGEIRWADPWSNDQIEAGRRYEHVRRAAHYDELHRGRGVVARLWRSLKSLFSR